MSSYGPTEIKKTQINVKDQYLDSFKPNKVILIKSESLKVWRVTGYPGERTCTTPKSKPTRCLHFWLIGTLFYLIFYLNVARWFLFAVRGSCLQWSTGVEVMFCSFKCWVQVEGDYCSSCPPAGLLVCKALHDRASTAPHSSTWY